MSGLVAVFDRAGRGSVDGKSLQTMHESLAHRGPDGDALWSDGSVGLGHQQLVTTPEALFDDQPHRSDGLVVVADTRLDNRAELLAALPVETGERPVPDSHLLLAAYRQWGKQCVDHLIGAFAFVIWDQGSLFCARDHFGVKPLYYHCTDELFAIASEPKAILAHPSVATAIDETKVGDFLTDQFEDQQRTFHEAVRRLPPAHAMTVGSATRSSRQYWDLDPTRTLTLGSDAAYEQRFRELFEQAVADRLRTEEPVATTLSGGLDSSSITGVARDLLPGDTKLWTFSGVFDDIPSCDEREYIDALAQRDGIEPQYVTVDNIGLLDETEEALAYHDAPVNNAMHHMKWAIMRRADEAGVGVVLDGAHGDSAVDYGLGLLPQLARTGHWWQLTRELQKMGDILDVPARQLFVQHVLPPLVPEPAKRRWRQVTNEPTDARRANPTLAPEFVDRIDLDTRYRRLNPVGSVCTRSARRWQYRSVMTGTMTTFLEESDRLHAAFGVEPRYPFIDKRLIEFTLAIPPTQQLSNGWTRSILRRSLDDYLPDPIQWRPWKTLLNPAFQHALAAETDALGKVAHEPGELARYLDPDALSDSYTRFTEAPNPQDEKVLWKALSLSAWLQSRATGHLPRSPVVQ